MDEKLQGASSECLCGRWLMLAVDDRGPGRVFLWAPDDETQAEISQPPVFRGEFHQCRCGRVYRALNEDPWIEETPLKEGHLYRLTTGTPEPEDAVQFVCITQQGKAQFHDEHTDYVFEAHQLRGIEPEEAR
jgi:hypothetical protein